MKCSNCQAEIPEDARFCPSCGQKIEQAPPKCASCGHEISPGQRFCPYCGTRVESSDTEQPSPVPVAVGQGPAASSPLSSSTSGRVQKKGGFPWKIVLSIGCLFSIFICVGLFALIYVRGVSLATMSISADTFATKTPQAAQVDTKSTPTPVKSTPTPAKATATVSAATTSAKLQNISLGLGLDNDQRVTNLTTTIQPDTPKIYLSTEVLNVKSETEVWVNWYYLDTNDEVDGPSQYINEDSRLGFSLSKPTNGWPVGQYKAVIYIDNIEAGSISFSCK